MNRLAFALALFLTAGLAACGKSGETASQKATEKAIESQLSKDGTQAKVELSGQAAKITSTDASGKVSQLELGAAQISEAELGVPFYPGTKPLEGQATKVSTPDGQAYTVGLHSADPADKVAAFYRDKLKALSQGKQFLDMSGADGATSLMLADDQSSSAIQVHVAKAEQGSDIQIVANRKAAK
jgi:hypothetical protein